MAVPSLVDMCRRRATKDVGLIYDIADIPYSLVESILRHVENPAQLQELEENSPQLQGETAALWLKFIKRDIPNWDKKPHEPRDPRNWSKVYRKLKRESEKDKQEQSEALKQQLRAIQENRAQNKTVIVDSKVGFGARSSRIFMGGSSSAWGGSGAPSKTGKIAMDKLKRGMFDNSRARPKAIQIPTHMLAARKRQVIAAPARMVRIAEHEASTNTLLSRSIAAPPVARRTDSTSVVKPPKITQRPIPQQSTTAPRAPPPAQSLAAPKPPVAASSASPAPKRKRQEASLFHKRRKI